MSEYTPTTENIRTCYIYAGEQYDGTVVTPVPIENAEFDRWLADHDRQVAAKALTDAARLARSYDANHVADILDERAVSTEGES